MELQKDRNVPSENVKFAFKTDLAVSCYENVFCDKAKLYWKKKYLKYLQCKLKTHTIKIGSSLIGSKFNKICIIFQEIDYNVQL